MSCLFTHDFFTINDNKLAHRVGEINVSSSLRLTDSRLICILDAQLYLYAAFSRLTEFFEEVIILMAFSPTTRAQIFLCYDVKDQARKDELIEQLAYCQRFWAIDVWDSERILAGRDVKAEITNALAAAKVAVLLVSASFLASEWITEYELPELLRAAEMEGLRLIPILLSPCLYQDTELRSLQYINRIILTFGEC